MKTRTALLCLLNVYVSDANDKLENTQGAAVEPDDDIRLISAKVRVTRGAMPWFCSVLPVLLALVGLLISAARASGQETPGRVHMVRTFGPDAEDAAFNTRNFSFSPEVVLDPNDGTIRLAHSELLVDESGATDFRHAEVLSDRVWAKKTFYRYAADFRKHIASAELFIFGTPAKVLVNTVPLRKLERLPSTGWMRVPIPVQLLDMRSDRSEDKPGRKQFLATEVILAGGGSVLAEPKRIPGNSRRSTDGGQTWSDAGNVRQNEEPVEYLVRLRLGCYPKRGWALSPLFDLWGRGAGEPAVPGRVVVSASTVPIGDPSGPKVFTQLRTGSTPIPDEKNWTFWGSGAANLDRDRKVPAGNRWAQLRFELVSSDINNTPRIPRKFDFSYQFSPDASSAGDKIQILRTNEFPVARSSVPFVYQQPSPRLTLLRERYQLDKVIAPGETEMERLMLLRHWVRNQWHSAWGSHPAAWMPPWDSHIILESKDQPDCLTMCTHYAAVFTQCCLALGWNARHCILDHHCVSEVFVNQHNKWAMMDAGNSKDRADVGLHFERNGVPLSALELHLAHRTGKTDGIMVCFTPAGLAQQIAALCRPEPPTSGKLPHRPDVIPLSALGKYPVCQLKNYRRYAFPGRNNYLDSLYPGELYQGWSEYFYDGYWWVGDSPDHPQLSPEYSRHLTPSWPQDIDWSLNWTRAHFARTAIAGELQVDLATLTPNLARLERWVEASAKAAQGSWQPVAPRFVWKLKTGKNTLTVRSVNRFERPGVESRAQVEWKPET